MEVLITLCCPTPEVEMIIKMFMFVYTQAPILIEIIIEILLDPTHPTHHGSHTTHDGLA